MKNYKAIISDIDGTLAPLALHAIVSYRVKKAIRSLSKKKIAFVLATGKPFPLIEHLIDELELTSPVIVDNGAAIYNAATKKSIWRSVMDKEKLIKIIEIAKQYRKTMRVSSGQSGVEVTDKIPDNFEVIKFRLIDVPAVQANEFTHTVERQLKDVAVIKASAYKGKDFVDVYVTNADATKLHAVVKTAEILKINTKEIIGIGDHYNDFPLLMACGLKVAMGNAVNDLKAIADYIAPSVEKDGLAEVIEKFCP